MAELVVAPDDPGAADVRALLERHLAFANEHSPPEDVHALDGDGLRAAGVSFFSVRDGGRLVAVGALKQLDGTHAEIKSMHTAAEARGRGAGRAMLEHLLAVAREHGCARVSLETGSMDAFAPARALYASAGFELCPPFGDYRPSPNSVCMTLELGAGGNTSPGRRLRAALAEAVAERRARDELDRPRSGRFDHLAGAEAIRFATTGRRTGIRREKWWIPFVADGDTLYLVEELGDRADWVRNALAAGRVEVWTGDDPPATASARTVDDPAELDRARRLLGQRFGGGSWALVDDGYVVAFDAM